MATSGFPEERFTAMPPTERGGEIMWEWGLAENNRSVPQPRMSFYFGMPHNAPCVFSLDEQVKAPRVISPMGAPKRPVVAWDNTQIEREAYLLRTRLPEEAKKVVRPSAWEDLYSYFDAYDLWLSGAWNLWCVIDLLGEQNEAHRNLRKAAAAVATTATAPAHAGAASNSESVAAAAIAQDRLKDYLRGLEDQHGRFQIIDNWVYNWLTREENRLKISKWDHSTSILFIPWPEDYMSIGGDLLADEAHRLQEALEYWHKEYYCASETEPVYNGPPDPRYPVTPDMIRIWTGCRFRPREMPVTDDSVDNLHTPVDMDKILRPSSSAGSPEPTTTGSAVKDESTQSLDTKAEEIKAPKRLHKSTKSGPVAPIPVDPELANRRDGVEKSGPSRLPSRSMEPPAQGTSPISEGPVAQESTLSQTVQINTVKVPNANMPPTQKLGVPSQPQRQRAPSFCLNTPYAGHFAKRIFKECPCTRCTHASRSVFVRNFDLDSTMSTNDKRSTIISFFGQWGEVEWCSITVSQSNRGPYAIVRFRLKSCAETAIHAARGLPLPSLSSSLWTWYPHYHTGWRIEPHSPTRWKLSPNHQARPEQNGSPYRPKKTTRQPQNMGLGSSGYASVSPHGPVNHNGPLRVSPERNMPVIGHQQHPGMASWKIHSQPVESVPTQPMNYGNHVPMGSLQGYGGPPLLQPDAAFYWQYQQHPQPMSAPLSGYYQDPCPITREAPVPHSAGWFPPQRQPPYTNNLAPEAPVAVQSKVPLEALSCPNKHSIYSTSSDESGIRVRLPSMSPEKAISSGRESPVTTKEPATPEKQTLGSLDPSIVAEGNVVTQFSQEDIRSEQGYSATVIHRPERQNNYRRVQSLWVMANTNHQQPQQVTHNEPAAKKYKNKRSNNSGSRPSTPIDPENKVEAAIAQNRQQAPATKGYRANAGGSLKMTKNRNGLAIDTRRSQDQLVPAAEKLNKNEVKTESGASLTVDVHLQHRVSESSILTGRSYHSAKSTFSSPNSNPDSADGQPFVSAPQTPMEFNGNPSPALTAIPAERCQLTPRASPESLRVDDSTPKPAAASKDKTGEPVITQALEEKTSRNAKSDSSSSNKPDEKKPASRPPSRAEGRRFKSSNKGEGQKPQSANKTENKPRPSTPVQPTAREAQHEKTVEPKPREKMNPATSTQSSTKEVQEKKPEKAKPTASTQSSSKTEEKKAGAPADARPAAKAQESKPEASVNAQPGNNSKKKKSQAARKTDAQSADSAEGKEGSLNDTKADDVKPGQVHDKSNKAENKPNKIADKPTEAVEKSKPSSFSAATQPAEPPLSSSPQTSPMKKNKKAIKKRNMARKKLHEASVASVPGAA